MWVRKTANGTPYAKDRECIVSEEARKWPQASGPTSAKWSRDQSDMEDYGVACMRTRILRLVDIVFQGFQTGKS